MNKEEVEIEYWPNGKKRSEIPLKNGKKEGIQRCWREDGMIDFEAPFKNGLNHGLYRDWTDEGSRMYLFVRREGLLHGVEVYFKNLVFFEDCI